MAVDFEKLRAAAQRVAASHGLDVVDLDFAGGGKFRALRVFVEKNAEGRAKLAEAAKAAQEAMAAGGSKKRGAAEAERLLGRKSADNVAPDQADAVEEQPEESGDIAELDDLESLPSAVIRGELSIEHLSGVTHEDCEQFSRDFGTLLDVEDLVPGTEYTLEVSSPGLDRKLSIAADYERFVGSLVKLQTFEPVNGNRHWKGRILKLVDGKLELDTSEEKRKSKKKAEARTTSVEVQLSNVEKANLVPEF
jgi:ribosome maturation factor RimP